MAQHNKYFDFCMKWEGGYGVDHAGGTKHGVTIGTWRLMGENPDRDYDGDIDNDDVKLISLDDARKINKRFWDKCKGDYINNQAVANAIVDWYWNSGITGIKRVQRVLGVKPDGIFGMNTLAATNGMDAHKLFEQITSAHRQFYTDLVKSSPEKYKKFLKGWLNRLNALKFE